MSAWVKSLWKDTIVYGIGYGVSRFLQIIILPIIAQALTLSEFGYYSNYVIFYTFAAGFFVLGLDSAVARYFYESKEKSYHRQLFSTAFFFILVVSIIGVLGISLFAENILSGLGIPAEYAGAIPYVLACIPVFALNNLFLSWFKWNRQKINFLINSGGSVVLLLLPLLVASKVSFIYIFQVIFLGQLAVAAASCFLARDVIRLSFNTKLLRTLLVYGFPWLLVFLFGVSRTYLDRIFLTQYLPADSYGVYNFAVRLSTLLSLVTTAFDMSFGPLAFSIWNKEGAASFFARLQSAYVFIICSLACAITVASPLLILFLGGQKYAGAEKVLPLLLFAAVPVSLVNFSNLGASYAKKSVISTITLLIGLVIVLALNFLLTRPFLQYGATTASLIGQLAIIISGYFFSSRYYRIPFNYARDGGVFLLFLALSLLFVNVTYSGYLFYELLVKSIILALVVIFLAVFQFKKEYHRLLSVFRVR